MLDILIAILMIIYGVSVITLWWFSIVVVGGLINDWAKRKILTSNEIEPEPDWMTYKELG